MEQYVPQEAMEVWRECLKQEKPLPLEAANDIADAMKNWALEHGATHFTHWFQPLTGVTAEKHEGFIKGIGGGRVIMDFSGKELDLRRTGCLQLPLRRSARDVRGPRLQRVGPHVFRLHQGRQSLHPDGVLLLRRRGARQEDTAAALDGGREPRGGEDPAALRRREGAQGDAPDRCRAGVLPDRPLALSAARGSAPVRPHALRQQAAQGAGAGRPLLRRHPPARRGLYEGPRRGALEARRARPRRSTTRWPPPSTRWLPSIPTPTPPTTRTSWSWRR